jgi:hypothetical protein
MKQQSLRASILGAVLIAALFSFSMIQISSAQSVSSSTSPTSAPSVQPSSTPSLASSSNPISTPGASSTMTASSSSQASASSSPAVVATSSYEASSSLTPNLTQPSSSSAAATSTPPTLPSPPPPPPQPTGYPTCDQTVKNVPGDYPTIQAAINAASIGDTVKIAAGTYNEDLTLTSGICLEGAGIDQTTISKSGASGIAGNGVSYAIIKDLTVKNSGCAPGVCGGGGNGGGIQLSQSSNITIQSCRLTGNVAVDGGGMSVSQSSITMNHCLIDGYTANNEGAGMVKDPASTISLMNVTVANNIWVNPLGNGGVGGIKSDGSGLQIANSILWGNNSQNLSGNGVQVSNSDIGGWSGGTNNVTDNPGFVSATDYHLQASSPSAGMGSY